MDTTHDAMNPVVIRKETPVKLPPITTKKHLMKTKRKVKRVKPKVDDEFAIMAMPDLTDTEFN